MIAIVQKNRKMQLNKCGGGHGHGGGYISGLDDLMPGDCGAACAEPEPRPKVSDFSPPPKPLRRASTHLGAFPEVLNHSPPRNLPSDRPSLPPKARSPPRPIRQQSATSLGAQQSQSDGAANGSGLRKGLFGAMGDALSAVGSIVQQPFQPGEQRSPDLLTFLESCECGIYCEKLKQGGFTTDSLLYASESQLLDIGMSRTSTRRILDCAARYRKQLGRDVTEHQTPQAPQAPKPLSRKSSYGEDALRDILDGGRALTEGVAEGTQGLLGAVGSALLSPFATQPQRPTPQQQQQQQQQLYSHRPPHVVPSPSSQYRPDGASPHSDSSFFTPIQSPVAALDNTAYFTPQASPMAGGRPPAHSPHQPQHGQQQQQGGYMPSPQPPQQYQQQQQQYQQQHQHQQYQQQQQYQQRYQ